jgi:hypothetical protein
MASLEVRRSCDRLKMIRTNTVPDATEMVKLHALRDWPNHLFVHDTMCVEAATRDGHFAVSHVVDVPNTDPARRFEAAIFLSVVV